MHFSCLLPGFNVLAQRCETQLRQQLVTGPEGGHRGRGETGGRGRRGVGALQGERLGRSWGSPRKPGMVQTVTLECLTVLGFRDVLGDGREIVPRTRNANAGQRSRALRGLVLWAWGCAVPTHRHLRHRGMEGPEVGPCVAAAHPLRTPSWVGAVGSVKLSPLQQRAHRPALSSGS